MNEPLPMPERRRDRRLPLRRAVKLQCLRTGHYYAGYTTDVSNGGVLLELAQTGRFDRHHPVRLVLSRPGRHIILPATGMAEARVVRSEGPTVAVAYRQRQVLAAAG